MLKNTLFAWLLLFPVATFAAETNTSSSGSGTLQMILNMGLGLAVVLVLIFGCAWLMRRVNGIQGAKNSAMQIISVISVGQRERILLLEVGEQQILVGVTAQNVRTLHVFDEPVLNTKVRGESDFATRLQSMLQKGFKAADKGSDVEGRDQ